MTNKEIIEVALNNLFSKSPTGLLEDVTILEEQIEDILEENKQLKEKIQKTINLIKDNDCYGECVVGTKKLLKPLESEKNE